MYILQFTRWHFDEIVVKRCFLIHHFVIVFWQFLMNVQVLFAFKD